VNIKVDAPMMVGPALGIWSVLFFWSSLVAMAAYVCFESSNDLEWIPFCDETHERLSIILMVVSFPLVTVGLIYITAKCWVPWCGYCLNAT
jgi:hypothetical protein